MLISSWLALSRTAIWPLALLALVLAPALARAEVWEINRQTTFVTASWDHLGLSRHSLRALDIRGTADFTPTDPAAGKVAVDIQVGGLSSGSRELDQLLKGADFLDAVRFPDIRFRSLRITATGERTADIEGELTVRDVSRPIVLKTRWNFTGEHPLAAINPRYVGKWVSGFSAEALLKRSEFGLARGIPLVGDEIRVTIEAEFNRQD